MGESDGQIAHWKTRNGKTIISKEIKEGNLAEVVVNE